MALHSTLEIYGSIFGLLGVAQRVVLQMRRDVKKLFGEKIIEACARMDLHVRAANMAADKEPHLLRLLEELELVELYTRGCRDWGYLPNPGYAAIIERTQSIGRQCNGWRKEQAGSQQRQLFDR